MIFLKIGRGISSEVLMHDSKFEC